MAANIRWMFAPAHRRCSSITMVRHRVALDGGCFVPRTKQIAPGERSGPQSRATLLAPGPDRLSASSCPLPVMGPDPNQLSHSDLSRVVETIARAWYARGHNPVSQLSTIANARASGDNETKLQAREGRPIDETTLGNLQETFPAGSCKRRRLLACGVFGGRAGWPSVVSVRMRSCRPGPTTGRA
jgi:hypothetical protein